MTEQFAFNIHAELYENKDGELAIRFADEKVFRGVGGEEGRRFQTDVMNLLQKGERPEQWREMPPHKLLYAESWHCISRLGYIDGDESKPALELEVEQGEIGYRGKVYLADILH